MYVHKYMGSAMHYTGSSMYVHMYIGYAVYVYMYMGSAEYVHMYIGSAVYVYMSVGLAIMCAGTWLSSVCTWVQLCTRMYMD